MNKNWISIGFIIYIIFFLSQAISAQEIYSKVKINLEGKDIKNLSSLGLETDHGQHIFKRSWTHIFSKSELKEIKKAGFDYKLIISDVQANYHAGHSEAEHHHHHKSEACPDNRSNESFETPENYRYGSMGGFLKYEELLAELDSMHAKYPQLVSKIAPIADIKTHNDSLIYFIKVTNPATDSIEKPQILYTALHHAREPTSLSQMIYYLWYLFENYETNEEVRYLVDYTEMYFIPCINVDGYIHNQTTNPNGGGLWRKNRYTTDNGQTTGVDLNRNYGYEWGFDDNGSSPAPNSQVYRGETAFSEPETQAVKEFCENHNFSIALNYHASGMLLIHPWGYNDQITNEDNIFKGMGNLMTETNNFTLGTSTETVGYIVNGSSDDWMYGEEETKNKIYAMTPEMGQTFWPQQDEIDGVNKTGMRQNLNAARLTQNYVNCTEINTDNSLYSKLGVIDLNLDKIGLLEGVIGVSTEQISNGVTIISDLEAVDLILGEQQSFQLSYELDDNYRNGDTVAFNLVFNNGSYSWKKRFEKIYVDAFADELYDNSNDSLDGYLRSGTWGLSDEYFYSAPTSITDSPNGVSQRNATKRIMIENSIDLSEVDNAELRFKARWDIEELFDYVQIEISSNLTDYTPICGMFTKPGEATQAFEEPLYDGQQSDWVEEIIDLSDYVGETNVYVRFEMVTDFIEERDGFYFDDLKLITYRENTISDITDLEKNINISVSPNPVSSIAQIEIPEDQFTSDLYYEMVDSNGKLITRNRVTKNQFQIDLSSFSTGIYFLNISKSEKVISSKKLVR